MRNFTAPSSAGPFVIAWRNVTPFHGRNTHFASICLQIAGTRFGAWAKKQSAPDFVQPFCGAIDAILKHCDAIPPACRGELLACPPLELAAAMRLALSGKPLPRRLFPACHAAQVAGRFELRCFELGREIYDFPATEVIYMLADASVCRVVAARCTWKLDRCLIREKTLVEAWVSRTEMERLIAEMAAFDASTAR